MEQFQIIRDHMDDRPTTGRLVVEGEHFAWTLERPWESNKTNLSCIPRGVYTVKMGFSPHFNRNLPRVLDVPGREGILLHALNRVSETEGCIGLGDSESGYTLFNSADAINRFVEWLISVGSEASMDVSVSIQTPGPDGISGIA